MADDRNNTVVSFPHKKSIRTQASEWLAKLDGDSPSEQDVRAFQRWIREDASHRDEFERLISSWDDLNVLTQLSVYRPSRRPSWLVPWSWSVAQSVAVGVAVLSVLVVGMLSSPWVNEPDIYRTATGEQRTIMLADGSEVALNTASTILVSYDDETRGVDLMQGEAHFNVKKHQRRPFEVRVRGALVRAIGTSFSIRVRPRDVHVIVTEGVIEIDPSTEKALAEAALPTGEGNGASDRIDSMPETGLIRVEAGKSATFDDFRITNIQQVDASEVEHQLAWRKGMLYYDGEELEKVIADVSRYTRIRIVVPEQAARQLRVGGQFRIGDLQALFEALEQGFGINVEYVSDDLVYLTYPLAKKSEPDKP